MINLIDKKFSDESIEALNAPLTKNEIKKAIHSSKNGKTPGWDGLPAEFYKKFDKQLLPLLLELANYKRCRRNVKQPTGSNNFAFTQGR